MLAGRQLCLLPAPVCSSPSLRRFRSFESLASTVNGDSPEPSTVERKHSRPMSTYLPEDYKKAPWKYQGYPGLCKYVAAADNLLVIRRFNESQTRVVLHLQDEIERKELELKEIDESCRHGGILYEHLGRLRGDPHDRRQELLKEMRALFKEYNDYIISYSNIRERSSASMSQTQHIRGWFENNRDAIDVKERQFIDKGPDLIPLVPRPKSWLGLGVEALGKTILKPLFRGDRRRISDRSDQVVILSTRGMSVVITMVIVTFGLACLLGPMWWLNSVHSTDARLRIISGWIIGFSIVLGAATVEQPMQILVGTAAYAAVLMVFLQLGPGPGPAVPAN